MFRILVVDDDKNSRRYYHAVLSHSGYQPFCADSAENAFHLLEEKNIDLLLVDALMPGTDEMCIRDRHKAIHKIV